MGNFRKDNKFGGKRGRGGFSGRSDRSDRSDRGGFSDRGGRSDRDSERPEMHKAVCNDCGDRCEVPFRPTGSKPVLCSSCFGNKKGQSDSRGFDRRPSFDRSESREKRLYQAVCGKCGEDCEVPFKPTNNKPVFCSHCFDKGGNENITAPNPNAKQLEIINSKIDRIIKMLNAHVDSDSKKLKSEKPTKTKAPERKAEDEIEEMLSDKKVVKKKVTKKKVVVKEKKAVAPKKKKTAKKTAKKNTTKKK